MEGPCHVIRPPFRAGRKVQMQPDVGEDESVHMFSTRSNEKGNRAGVCHINWRTSAAEPALRAALPIFSFTQMFECKEDG